MNTNDKTLADVQPGGRVRLGDQAELDRLEFQAWARWFVAPVERDQAGDYISDFTRGLWCAWQAALSAQPSPGVVHPAVIPDTLVNGGALKMALNVLRRAGKNEVADELESTATIQPSPGGQDARAQFEEYRGGDCERDAQGYYVNARTAQDWAMWQAALAARQSVGEESVAYWLAVDEHGIVEFGASTDDVNEGHAARQEVNDFINDQLRDDDKQFRLVGVYAAPHAQCAGDPVAWMTNHDEPMLFPTAAEAAAYCEDDEQPVPLFRSPAQAVDLGPSQSVLAEVAKERARQEAKWGQQNHVDWTPTSAATDLAGAWPAGVGDHFKFITDYKAKGAEGHRLGYFDILMEEVAEAHDEARDGNTKATRTELVQVAAVAVAWIECIDRRMAVAGRQAVGNG